MKNFVFLLIGMLCLACQEEQKTPESTPEPVSLATPSLPIMIPLGLQHVKGDTVVHIEHDLFFKKPKSYQAYSLQSTLQDWVSQLADTSGVDVIFTCTDGYAPSMPLNRVLAGDGFLAYRDMSLKGGNWPDSIHDKFTPYYLVWTHLKGPKEGFHWPYGLASLRLNLRAGEFAAALPPSEATMAGYGLFKDNCMKCHAINKVGGQLGPEFNYPRNITEYWEKETIWEFVKAPQSFRYNSKMPPQPSLQREDFEHIYAYLQSMKGQQPK
jgi:cytochrome c2